MWSRYSDRSPKGLLLGDFFCIENSCNFQDLWYNKQKYVNGVCYDTI